MQMTKEDFDRLWSEFAPAQVPEELWWLCERLNELQPSRCLEIGSGSSGIYWGFFAPTISLTMAQYSQSDIPHTPQEFAGFERITHPASEGSTSSYLEDYGVTTYIGDSHKQSTLDQLTALGPYDFLFIDGDHSRIGVEQDIRMYVPLVNPGGLVAFHDWDHTGTYPPDSQFYTTKEACRNTGLFINEIKVVRPPGGMGIAVHRVPE